ncbi:ABC transporter substrate-binding protein [Xenophilus azovorans]|uniref:ABC transporter substrate-binding protein n=1 Tax=Xenophilus azovorans TaxID=151755 RepID=UPI00056EF7CA|nr:ABC transporter substrate-binding protein [Xenophilus azovorans]
MNRRDFIAIAGSSAAVACLPGNALAQSQGVLLVDILPLSGPLAGIGRLSDLGAKAALAERGGKVNGLTVERMVLDSEANPAKAVRKVIDAMEQRKALIFTGEVISAAALSISKEVAKAGGVYITAVGADEVTGADCNASTFRYSVPTFGAVEQSVRPLAKLLPAAKRWYTITPQVVFGEGMLANAKRVFSELNIEHVGNTYHSLQDREFSGYLTAAAAAKPDVLLLLNYAGQLQASIRQAANFGLTGKTTILATWTTGLHEYHALGADLMEGVYAGAQYWHTLDTPANQKFVRQCKELYNETPDHSMALGYSCAKLMLDGIALAGSTSPTAIAKKLEGYKYAGLTGEEQVRDFDHQVIKNYYLLKGKPKSQMKDKDDFVEVLSGGKSFPDQARSACKMRT